MFRRIIIQDIRVYRLVITIGLLLFYNSSYSQNKRALLIGISDYQLINNTANSWENIHGSNDVAILSPTLQQHGFKVTSIVDQQATAANIRKQLSKLSSSCKPGDIVYLHFSCHGQPVEDIDGDEPDGWDEAIVPVDAQKSYVKDKYEGENHIIDDELNRFFCTIRSKIGRNGYLTVVVDACHAGTSFRGEESEDSVFVRGTNTGFSERGKKFVPKIDKRGQITIQTSPDMSDICIIEACRSYQVNSEIKVNNQYYGSLSYYLNVILKSNDKIIWQEPWYNDVLALMARDSRLIRQNPVIEISK